MAGNLRKLGGEQPLLRMTFSLYVLGCKINGYEGEALREELLLSGFRKAEEGESPDYYFLLTCAVTNQSERKDSKSLHEIHKRYPDARIVVLGCSSQIHKERYLSYSGVKAVYGTANRHLIVDNLKKEERDFVLPNPRLFDYDPLKISSGQKETRTTLKIQDGCDNFCTYCLIPYSRGRSRSRRREEILSESLRLLESGVKELVVSGIDVGSYQDPEREDYRLSDLLLDLAVLPFQGPYRLRVSSIELSQIDEKYLAAYQEYPDRIVPHFHIPLQSGSEKILKKMNRKYDLSRFLSVVQEIHGLFPNAGLSTDVIAGFPGETEEDFQETCSFLKEAGFMRIHAFPYSERPGTMASGIKDGIVPYPERRRRVKELIALSEEQEALFRKSLDGKKVTVLWDSCKDNVLKGYSENYLSYERKGDKEEVGTFSSFISH